MDRKNTIETQRWSEPDEQRCVKMIGMRTFGEVFEDLKSKLEQNGMIPDEYLLLNSSINKDTPLPSFNEAICHVNFGGSEGIYMEIDLPYRDESGQPQMTHFATGKTLGETVEDFYRISLIAGECSMLLNGEGCAIENNTHSILFLDEEQEKALKAAIELTAANTQGYMNNETADSILVQLSAQEQADLLDNEEDDEMED